MEHEKVADLEVTIGSDGSVVVRWDSRRSEPPRRLPIVSQEMPRRAMRWFGGAAVLMVVPAIGAVVAGARLLGRGDWVWGGLAMAAGLLLVLHIAFFATMSLSLRWFRRGDTIVLKAGPAKLFNDALAERQAQLQPDASLAERRLAATQLWQMACNLHQSSTSSNGSSTASPS